jgi:L-lactate utilization protein LutC
MQKQDRYRVEREEAAEAVKNIPKCSNYLSGESRAANDCVEISLVVG